jgi:hypothetical protein
MRVWDYRFYLVDHKSAQVPLMVVRLGGSIQHEGAGINIIIHTLMNEAIRFSNMRITFITQGKISSSRSAIISSSSSSSSSMFYLFFPPFFIFIFLSLFFFFLIYEQGL